jgi:hypothetical protein
LVASVSAQDTVTGAFEGIVSDSQTGAPLKGAAVEIINQQTGLTINLNADYLGRFYQGLLIPGIYRVRVSRPGYQTREVFQRLKITYTGEVVPVPVALDPLPPSAGPTGTAAPPPVLAVEDTDVRASVNRSNGRRSGSFSEEEVSTLPLRTHSGRTFDDLALLLPGVAPPPETLGAVAGPGVGAGVGSAGQFAVNGLRSRANNFTVDGSDNNDEDIGVRRQGFVSLIAQPVESIKEYQVITLLAPAQFGRSLGAQVNAVSKSGGDETHGAVYGFFNSSQLNARNFFDTTLGSVTTPLRAGGDISSGAGSKPVLLNGSQVLVRNQSGGEDSFTLGNLGGVVGGPFRSSASGGKRASWFYFVSAEGQVINATREASFAVPTVEDRGIFKSGATGLAMDPFSGNTVVSFPSTISGEAIFSLYPFPNNIAGIYGPNTFTQALPAAERGKEVSGKIDANFKVRERQQGFTSRYNFTDDWRDIAVTGGALFSTLRPRVRTQNLSNFLNSEISALGSVPQIFNQLRASYGRTRLVFDENRNTEFLLPSRLSSSSGNEGLFLLNTRLRVNDTLPGSSSVFYDRFFNFTTEDILGPLGQVKIAGFSPIGVDVFNFPQRRVNNTYQLADNLTIRFGNHNVALGTDLRRSELNSDLPTNSRPLITFAGAPRLSTVGGLSQLQDFVSPIDLAAASAPSGVFQAVTPGTGSAISLRYYQYNFFGQDQWRVRPNLSIEFGVRYEYNTPPRELRRRIENTFNDPSLSLVPGLAVFLAGRKTVFDPDRNNLGPRFGIAYSPNLFGKGLTSVFRAGYGMFFDQVIGAVVSQSRNVFPNFLTLNFAGGVQVQSNVGFNITDPTKPFFPCRDSTGVDRFFPVTQAGTLNRLNPTISLQCLATINNAFPGGFGFTLPARKLSAPMAHHYSFTFEQQLRNTVVLSIAYVGTKGSNLLRLTTPNLGGNAFLIPTFINVVNFQPNVVGRALGPGQVINPNGSISGGRPVSQAGSVSIYSSSSSSRYDSLQLQLRGRLPRAAQYQVAYTFSNATDDASDVFDLAGAAALPQNSLTFNGERGPANFDARHRISYHVIYDIPFGAQSNVLRWLARGLQISSTGRFQTGQPFTVNSIFDVNLDGNLTDRLDNTSGLLVTGNPKQPLIVTTPNQLSLLARIGEDGRVGRNTFRAGSLLDLDLSLVKNFAFRLQRRLTLRVDIFNFINRANFGVPVRYLGAAAFGRATDTVTPSRRLQLGLKYSF